ncbi:MAG: hypothetical protein JSV80_10350 [Acidobacteriota bacterium]|nr:MAG: hypothetical protein JSV80_10350 [Acidobacteriota bacterium]
MTDKAAQIDPIRRRRGLLAMALAWLFPGAGHWYVGARHRAFVFAALVLLTVGLGLACDGNLAVVDGARAPVLTTLQAAGNLALGPVDPLLRTGLYGMPIYRAGPQARMSEPRTRALEHRRERSFRLFSAYGSAYLIAAGLMNLLLILDAWDLAIGRKS